MTVIIGRETGDSESHAARLGSYRATDGSRSASLALDVDGPHAVLVVGKRGYGKTYTLGVLAEELARQAGIAPVVLDPMGSLRSLADGGDGGAEPVPARVVDDPTVPATALDPKTWCRLLELPPGSGVGGLLWRATAARDSLEGMCEFVTSSEAPGTDRRAAINHLRLAERWGVFDADGLSARDLAADAVTVVDLSELDPAPMNAVVRAIAESVYRARVCDDTDRLPWLLIDEAHAFVDAVAEPALRTALTRGRSPGVSLVLSTQRPSALPDIAISQSDLLLAHRLTSRPDIEALERARPTYVSELTDQLPREPGDVLIVDDTTEQVHTATVRRRDTPHAGDDPSLADRNIE